MAKLYFYYSAMNAGKSTILLQSSFNYKERGMNTMLFTSSKDNRYGIGSIKSRIGLAEGANLFSEETNILEKVREEIGKRKIDCVLLDESQFLTKEQVKQLCYVVDYFNIPVLCYGLRSDFKGELFTGSKYLLAWADKLNEVKTICHCGSKATMNIRIDSNGNPIHSGEQVFIGDETNYASVCRKHHILNSANQNPPGAESTQKKCSGSDNVNASGLTTASSSSAAISDCDEAFT
ncbi:thymidine kinase [Cryptosporidium ryanae]|uniref:thymidine kinase n=1 Tax=Cryptosporidium ryanae TaxID=515981 RepID=UPI00351AA92D|nr:thymidine kinase [Cryptosporidium ryanae]